MLFMASRSHLQLYCDATTSRRRCREADSDDDEQRHLNKDFMTSAVKSGIRTIEQEFNVNVSDVSKPAAAITTVTTSTSSRGSSTSTSSTTSSTTTPSTSTSTTTSTSTGTTSSLTSLSTTPSTSTSSGTSTSTTSTSTTPSTSKSTGTSSSTGTGTGTGTGTITSSPTSSSTTLSTSTATPPDDGAIREPSQVALIAGSAAAAAAVVAVALTTVIILRSRAPRVGGSVPKVQQTAAPVWVTAAPLPYRSQAPYTGRCHQSTPYNNTTWSHHSHPVCFYDRKRRSWSYCANYGYVR